MNGLMRQRAVLGCAHSVALIEHGAYLCATSQKLISEHLLIPPESVDGLRQSYTNPYDLVETASGLAWANSEVLSFMLTNAYER